MPIRVWPELHGFKANFCEGIVQQKISAGQATNAPRGALNYFSQFGPIFQGPSLSKPSLGFFRREPGWASIRLLGSALPQNLAKMGVNCLGIPRPANPVGQERNFFNPSMHSGFLKCLERSRLRVGESRFCTPFRKSPAAAACADQQELNLGAENSEANRR